MRFFRRGVPVPVPTAENLRSEVGKLPPGRRSALHPSQTGHRWSLPLCGTARRERISGLASFAIRTRLPRFVSCASTPSRFPPSRLEVAPPAPRTGHPYHTKGTKERAAYATRHTRSAYTEKCVRASCQKPDSGPGRPEYQFHRRCGAPFRCFPVPCKPERHPQPEVARPARSCESHARRFGCVPPSLCGMV